MNDLARLKRQMERNKAYGFAAAYARYRTLLLFGFGPERAWELAQQGRAAWQ